MQSKPLGVPSITSTNVFSSTILMSWSEVTGNTDTGYSPIITYKIYINDTYNVSSLQNSGYTINGLNALTTYKLEVSALNAHGESNKSTPVTVTTIDRPLKPNPVTVSEITNSVSIKFAFDETVSNGSPITSYEINFLNYLNSLVSISSCSISFDSGTNKYVCSVPMATLKSSLGLNNGDSIVAFVKGVNAEGASDFSDASNNDVKI